ncbi:MAG: DUF1549 and DUF1553 domain-containing protein [Planctomycetaceae bacterium]
MPTQRVCPVRRFVSRRAAMQSVGGFLLSVLCCFSANTEVADAADASIQRISANPPAVRLSGPDSRFLVLVDGENASGKSVDLTRFATFRSRDPRIADIDGNGCIVGKSDGDTIVEITAAGETIEVPISVRDSAAPRRFDFENDIVPILSRFGCNASGCHGKAEGQNGFKLSVFGFDPAADDWALKGEGRGRRVFPASPDQSLLLLKASGGVPHGGGIRLSRDSAEYRTLRDWIAAGMPARYASAPRVASIRVEPHERQMAMSGGQQLRVIATDTSGNERDVTAHARFQSNSDGLAEVDEFGLVRAGTNPGEVAIMAAYLGAVDVFRAIVPREGPTEGYPTRPVLNFIDEHVDAKLRKLNIVASELCDDAEFLRRIYLDLIGTLPRSDKARRFLTDGDPDRRRRLIGELLARPEFADFWAMQWADTLRIDRLSMGHKPAYSFHRWIRDSLRENKPYDRFVREIVAAEGNLEDAPAGNFYRAVSNPGDVAATLSQVFLGVRIDCAQCHHHPFDRWGQTDYLGMRAYFTQAGFKSTQRGLLLAALTDSPSVNPRTGVEVFAHALQTASPAASPPGDRRRLLAEWMTAPDNPWLAKNFVNRVWAHMLGVGLVEPVDDARLTNPPSNPELLDALAAQFIQQKFDVRALLRTIAESRTYQLSSRPNPTNERDERNYSRALFKRMDAEVLYDAVCQTTGIGEKFHGVPAGYRAIELWDSRVPHYFLRLFGRPVRATACQCERTTEPSVSQVLHILNSPEIHAKLSHDGGAVAGLVERVGNDEQLAEELYLTFFSRFPSDAERKLSVGHLASHKASRRAAAEDIAWSMMNSVEFLFNH